MNLWQRRTRKLLLALLGVVAIAAPAAAQDNYPSQPIHVVIGFAAGSGADILTRYFTDKLQAAAKQPVIVDNKPGATGNIALRAVADAKPDGYTLLFSANSNMAGSRYLFKDLPFDTLKDFVPIASFAQIAFVMVVSPKSPINSVADLTSYLKKKQGALSGYTNQTAQLSTEYYKQLAGVTTTPVAYAPKGTPQAIVDKLQGWILPITELPETAQFLKDNGAIPQHDKGPQADARLKAELPKWETLVKAAGIEPQ